MVNNPRITSITLENFKGISEPVTIPLRPITLLFGKNSAGKSTILQAMLYALEVIRTGNADIDKVQLGGDAINLGGFRNLVHKHDTNRNIRLRIEMLGATAFGKISMPDFELLDSLIIPEGHELVGKQFSEVDSDLAWMCGFYFELEIAYDLQTETANIICFSCGDVSDDGHSTCKMADIIYSHGGKHAALTNINKSYIFSELSLENEDSSIDYNFDLLQYLYGNISRDGLDDVYQAVIPFSTPENIGALPRQTGEFVFPTLEPADNEQDEDVMQYEHHKNSLRAFTNLLSSKILKPLTLASEILQDVRYIGPIREIPERNHQGLMSVDESRWATGLAAWDALDKAIPSEDSDLIEQTNNYLRDVLELGYELRKDDVIVVDANHDLFDLIDNLDEVQASLFQRTYTAFRDYMLSLPITRRLSLRDLRNNVEVSPCDIGVGVSQVVPVVVGALAKTTNGKLPSILSIEQPELHIHPAVQCALGDLFIREKSDDRIFLIETHSEHLILRFLRRIEETTDGDIKDQTLSLKPNDVGVMNVNYDDDKLNITELPINEDGEFTESWPGGFFEERATELFGESDA